MADKKQELAYARQLWRLNREGRLVLVGVGEVASISSGEADAAIKEGIALRGSVSEARAQ